MRQYNRGVNTMGRSVPAMTVIVFAVCSVSCHCLLPCVSNRADSFGIFLGVSRHTDHVLGSTLGMAFLEIFFLLNGSSSCWMLMVD